ncbi:MAG: AAA family ATPase [Verrucomicrobia bacterium]|nr:MAG: AAA family ATPase [Verrucomicrobiota bacterium]
MNHADENEVSDAVSKIHRLRDGMNQLLIGQEALIDHVLVGLLAGGHILLEGLPGLGKTELIKGLSRLIDCSTKRIQFTPDLLPGDITGNPILQEIDGRRVFVFQPGPLFANMVLADEINRASPKTQSALLEAMQERRVTVIGESHLLPKPFFVLATQNPIELEGTYPLPEAQLDRFLFKLVVTRNEVTTLEHIILNREMGGELDVHAVMNVTEFQQLMDLSRRIFISPAVANYIARLVDATHPQAGNDGLPLRYGASPRAALGMAAGARARGLMQGRTHTSFEDVKAIAPAVLGHRIVLDYRAKVSGITRASVIEELLARIPFQETETPRVLHA